MRSFYLMLVCIFVLPACLLANYSSAKDISGFEENNGQIRRMNGELAEDVKFRLSKNHAEIFLLRNGIAFQFKSSKPSIAQDELENGSRVFAEDFLKHRDRNALSIETYRMDLILEGASLNSEIISEKPLSGYVNDYRYEALEIRSYEQITYKEVYPGIDWVIYATDEGMTYDFLVHPGGDPENIVLRFEHHEELYIDEDGSLVHGNRLGRFIEKAPVSFQDNQEIETEFVLDGNTLRFSLGHYNENEILRIDPPRFWGTYYGSAADDIAEDCATDSEGNIYIAGRTQSTDAIAEAGHQVSQAGDFDAFLAKFAPNGVRLWATYYGGSAYDAGESCAVDTDGNIYLCGDTDSETGIASGGHLNEYPEDSGTNAFLVKFSPDGIRQWATYYGDSDEDTSNSCATDDEGNVYLVGATGSSSGIADGGFQNVLADGGSGDCFMVKFNSEGVRIWGTYFGAEGTDVASSVVVGPNGLVGLGGTSFTNDGLASENAHQTEEQGFGDGFLAMFNVDGERLWSTYYGGESNDNIQDIAIDQEGNLYGAGATLSTTGMADSGYDNSGGGSSTDMFLVKFDVDGERSWATYYGANGSDQGRGCAVDSEGNVYLVGQVSSDGLALDGFQNSYGGGLSVFARDGMVVKFDSEGTRIWATYYGSAGIEDGRGCAITPEDDVIMVGSTDSEDVIADNGHSNSFGGGGSDAFMVKLYGTNPLNVTDRSLDEKLKLMPNPNNGELCFLDLSPLPSGSGAIPVEIFDQTGKIVASFTLQGGGKSNALVPLHTNLPSGLYLIRVMTDERIYTVKSVVQR